MVQTYISLEEFNVFKKMTENKISQIEQMSADLAEIMISGFDRMQKHSDERFDGLTEKMMEGFERADKKFAEVDQKFEDMTNLMMEGFERVDKKFIEIDEKLENLTEIVIDGFDMAYDKLEA
ncbi:MAG: hypothetical protein Q8Q03_03190 [bacterium]|nr:hypothetical protein [bacterium]